MITPCSYCCFHRPEGPACLAGQCCIRLQGAAVAPGACRLFRTQQWLKNKCPTNVDAVDFARHESYLKFDLLVVFDERKHSMGDLHSTIDSVRGYERLIVADVTGETRKGMARKLVANAYSRVTHMVDCTVNPIDEFMLAVDYEFRLVKAPYFFAIQAGHKVRDMSEVADHINAPILSQAVYWYMPHRAGWSHVLKPWAGEGLYLTSAFKQLGGEAGKPFHRKLVEIEMQTGHSLSWLISTGETI